MRSKPLADHSAQRQTAKREPIDAERIDERKRVGAELLDPVIAGCSGRGAVTPHVVTQDTEMRRQIGDLRIPHPVILSE